MRLDNLEDKNKSFSDERPPTPSSRGYMVQYRENRYQARDGVMTLQVMDQICTKPLKQKDEREKKESDVAEVF